MWNKAFVQLWVGSEFYLGGLNTLLIVLMAIQYAFIRNDGNIIDLTLELRRKVIIGALSTIMSIALAALLFVNFNLGILGMMLGLLFGRSILSVAYPWVAGNILGQSLSSQLKKISKPTFTTALFLLVGLFIGNYVSAGNWLALGIGAVLTLVAATLLALYAGLTGNQRRRIIRRASSLLRPAM